MGYCVTCPLSGIPLVRAEVDLFLWPSGERIIYNHRTGMFVQKSRYFCGQAGNVLYIITVQACSCRSRCISVAKRETYYI